MYHGTRYYRILTIAYRTNLSRGVVQTFYAQVVVFFPTFVTVGLLVEGGPIDDFPRDVRA